MRITVFGANGPTGRRLTDLALAEGHEVVAFTRKPDEFPLEHPALRVVGGDIVDAARVRDAIDGSSAVLSTLGVPFSKAPITVYSDGVTNILAGMTATGVKRLACVSSSAVAPHPEPLGGFVFAKVLQPYVVGTLGRTLYADMRRMEAIVAASDRVWTIVRPSGLFDAPTVSAYGVERDHIGHRFTSRIDLADCLLRQATSDEYAGATIAVATPSANPSILGLIWREGIRKRAEKHQARNPRGFRA